MLTSIKLFIFISSKNLRTIRKLINRLRKFPGLQYIQHIRRGKNYGRIAESKLARPVFQRSKLVRLTSMVWAYWPRPFISIVCFPLVFVFALPLSLGPAVTRPFYPTRWGQRWLILISTKSEACRQLAAETKLWKDVGQKRSVRFSATLAQSDVAKVFLFVRWVTRRPSSPTVRHLDPVMPIFVQVTWHLRSKGRATSGD